MKYLLIILFYFIFISGCGDTDNEATNVNLYKGKVDLVSCMEVKNGKALSLTKEFDKEDMIYIYAKWEKLYGDHFTVCVFKDPLGSVRFNTEVNIKQANGTQATWYWVKLGDNDDNTGKWEANVYIDSTLAGSVEVLVK